MTRVKENSSPSRFSGRQLALAAPLLIALALAAGIAGYALGRSGGEDLEAARHSGAAAGQMVGAARGAATGFPKGVEAGRKKAFAPAYENAYGNAFETAGLTPPEEIKVPSGPAA